MQHGLEYLQKAKITLIVSASVPRERLATAGQLFWAAYYYHEQWPAEWRAMSKELVSQLLCNGIIADTVASMSDDEVANLSARMLAFLNALEQDEPRTIR